MHPKRTTKPGIFSYKIVEERISQDRIYQLVKFSLLEVSTMTRRRIMKRVLDETNAIGLIEWWIRGSIVKKPRQHFYGIVILKNT